jgi:PadR family transcriptional regulator, regulatory protein PadR
MSEPQGLGAFEEQVMLAVARVAGEAYGMSVRREIEAVTGRDVSIGAVYATLDRLEAKRLVASSRKDLDGASRRLFALTSAGVRALVEAKEIRDQLWGGLDPASLAAARRT